MPTQRQGPPSLRVDLESEELLIELSRVLPYGTKQKIFNILAKWVVEVRKQDQAGQWIGLVINTQEPDPSDVVRFGELVKSGAGGTIMK